MMLKTPHIRVDDESAHPRLFFVDEAFLTNDIAEQFAESLKHLSSELRKRMSRTVEWKKEEEGSEPVTRGI